MIRSDKWKQRIQCEPNPAKRNCLDVYSEDISESDGIENPRNCDDPCEKQQPYILDHDLSTVDCASPKTLDQSPLLNCAETMGPISPMFPSPFSLNFFTAFSLLPKYFALTLLPKKRCFVYTVPGYQSIL